MAFKPFGDRFEVTTLMTIQAAKAVIRSRKSGWLSAEGEPRGWIIGPFLCLWQSAFDQHGPMLIAYLNNDGFRTTIVGRAGADLNGTALFVLLTPLMAWVTWKMYETGQGNTKVYVMMGVVFGLGLPLILWLNSKDRRDADPLIKFVNEAVKTAKAS